MGGRVCSEHAFVDTLRDRASIPLIWLRTACASMLGCGSSTDMLRMMARWVWMVLTVLMLEYMPAV